MITRFILFAFSIVLSGASCFGQVMSGKEVNGKYLDSIRHAVETFYCQGDVKYQVRYDRNEVHKVVSVLKLINFITKNNVTVRQVDSGLSKIDFQNVDRRNDNNGLLRTTTVHGVLKYLSVTIKLVCIDDFVVTKKFVLVPTTTIRCPNYGNGLMDFKIVTDIYAKYIEYPVRVVDLRYLQMRAFDSLNLAKGSVSHKEYKYFTEQLSNRVDSWVNHFYTKQYDPDSSCCYSYVRGEKDMIQLIKEERYDVVRDLVFSPNYFYAISAMEAVLYLSTARKCPVDDQLKLRIEELKTMDFKIKVMRASDVIGWADGYKSLKTSDESVIGKYDRSLH